MGFPVRVRLLNVYRTPYGRICSTSSSKARKRARAVMVNRQPQGPEIDPWGGSRFTNGALNNASASLVTTDAGKNL